MTHEMPSTKPNIMITARLLLMPVLRSVELKVVDCASAGMVLRARTAAATRRDGSRERIFGWMCLMIFIRVVLFFIYWRSDLFAASHAHFARSKKIVGVRGTHLKKGFLLEVGDE